MLNIKEVRFLPFAVVMFAFTWVILTAGTAAGDDDVNLLALIIFLLVCILLIVALFAIAVSATQERFAVQQKRVCEALKAFDQEDVWYALHCRAKDALEAFVAESELQQPLVSEVDVVNQERTLKLSTAIKESRLAKEKFWALHDVAAAIHKIPSWNKLQQFAEVDPDANPDHWRHSESLSERLPKNMRKSMRITA